MSSQTRKSRSDTRATLTPERVAEFVSRAYDLRGHLRELPGERDRNFLCERSPAGGFVLKVAPADEPRTVLELQIAALRHLETRPLAIEVPKVVASAWGSDLVPIESDDGRVHLARLLSYLPGTALGSLPRTPPDLLVALGHSLAELDLALLDFPAELARRELQWDLTRFRELPTLLATLGDVPAALRTLLAAIFARAERELGPRLAELPRSVVHNDANDDNVLVRGSAAGGYRLAGLIDFGDIVETVTVAEVAIAVAYAMLRKRDPVGAAERIVAGYHTARPLTEAEVDLLYDLACLRLAMSVVHAERARELESGNAYLQVSQVAVRELLARLTTVHPRLARYRMRAACGFAPCPESPRIASSLRAHASELGPILMPDPSEQSLCWHDLSVLSAELESPIEQSPALWARSLARLREDAGASLGVGKYTEVRLAYAGGAFERPTDDGVERRTVHLGVDLFVDAGTPVLAPLAGRVCAVRDNSAPLDYGPTVVLEHQLGGGEGATFWTLYGHLDRDTLGRTQAGQHVVRGERIGAVGDAAVNGGWPPHVHVQIICDRLDLDGDYPGAAAPSELATWLSLSPDPNLLLRLPGRPPPRPDDAAEIATRRAGVLGPSLKLAYGRPLHIARGIAQHLYDALGQKYLDAVNNVPIVGHGHPRVARAAAKQARVLNTNTRYLHEAIVRYAERLGAWFPPPLRVCFFVNSGSEANELALRMARAHTGRRGVVVLEGGYHGNTSTLVDVSPYKFDGPGGGGRPDWVQVAKSPDPYRAHKILPPATARSEVDIAQLYAHDLALALARAQADGGAAAFLVEPIASCAGQIVPPPGYLPLAFEHARARGALCIADEVQTGLGRVGSHRFAFEALGVLPDIVTLGKPIGNGHPLGAVVTTTEIAASFANGMEYFNTFGGNPVSCAVGLAVLDIIEEEGLQAQAARVGVYLKHALDQLRSRFTLIGDVRGMGLFLGVELVRDHRTLQPGAEEARYVCERMRDRGVLTGVDGPLRNVLKIKPPLVFTERDADILVTALDRSLAEL